MGPHQSNWLYIINQFTFTGPSETMMFHVLPYALTSGYIIYRTRAKRMERIEEKEQVDLIMRDGQVYQQQTSASILSMIGQPYGAAHAHADANNLQQQQFVYQLPVEIRINPEDAILGRRNAVIILFSVITFANFIFATFHMFASGMDFFTFWNSGLGVVYWVAGMWMTYISIRYGWGAGVLTHAFWNSWMIILLIIFTAGTGTI